jgi:hypothetical protein
MFCKKRRVYCYFSESDGNVMKLGTFFVENLYFT